MCSECREGWTEIYGDCVKCDFVFRSSIIGVWSFLLATILIVTVKIFDLFNFYKRRSFYNLLKTFVTTYQILALFSHLNIDMPITIQSFFRGPTSDVANFDLTKYFGYECLYKDMTQKDRFIQRLLYPL